MIHPFEEKTSDLTDSQLDDKIASLTKKYFQAQRLGKYEMLTQISTFLTIYKDEMSRRNRARLRDADSGDLDQLINVD